MRALPRFSAARRIRFLRWLVPAFFFFAAPLLSGQEVQDPMIFGFGFTAEEDQIVIISVIANSPADEAGLQPGDVIVGINGGPLPPELLKAPRESFAKMIKVTFQIQSGDTTRSVSMSKKRFSLIAPNGRVRYAYPSLQMAGYRTGDVVADMTYIFKEGEKPTTLYQIKARYKLISFWATWCKACRDKVPDYTWARKRFSEKTLAIISVSLDENRSREVLYTQKHEMNWYHYREPGSEGNQKFNSQWKVYSIPVAVLLDQDHRIIEIITSQKRLAHVLEERL